MWEHDVKRDPSILGLIDLSLQELVFGQVEVPEIVLHLPEDVGCGVPIGGSVIVGRLGLGLRHVVKDADTVGILEIFNDFLFLNCFQTFRPLFLTKSGETR